MPIFARSMLPNRSRAAAAASTGLMGAARFRRVRSSRWNRISSSNSRSSEADRNRLKTRLSIATSGELQYAHDGVHMGQPVPLHLRDAAPSTNGDPVVPSAPVIVRRLPLGLHPAGFFHPVERRIQRTLLNPQGVA